MKKERKAVEVQNEVTIEVKGGYSPDVIKVKKDTPVVLNFHRTDESSCLEEVVLPDFGIRQYLGQDKITSIKIKPEKEGVFTISCGMNMFHGKIIVEK